MHHLPDHVPDHYVDLLTARKSSLHMVHRPSRSMQYAHKYSMLERSKFCTQALCAMCAIANVG